MTQGMQVLVTGGSGQLGRVFARHYGGFYRLRLTYHAHPIAPLPHPNVEVVPMDLTDYASVSRAMQGAQAVVHLGADSSLSGTWESVLANNIRGTYHAYEAAREAGVKRFVYASSNHAAGLDIVERDTLGPGAPIRPDSLYGVGKCFGESLGSYYHDQYGMQVTCLRIGSCHGEDDLADQRVRMRDAVARGGGHPYNVPQYLSIWLSNRDMTQLLYRSLETDCPWGIFYGISDNTPAAFDLSETKRLLGYAPQDNVQDLFDVPIASLGRGGTLKGAERK
jgi:uronate dehydrogenase